MKIFFSVIVFISFLFNAQGASKIFKDKRGITCCDYNSQVFCIGDRVTYSDPKLKVKIQDVTINSITQHGPYSECVVDFKSPGAGRVWEGDHEIKNVTLVSGGSSSGAGAAFGGGSDPNQKCAICLDDPKNPRDLICGHIFCRDCIKGWKARFREKEFPCPNCRSVQPKEIYGYRFCN